MKRFILGLLIGLLLSAAVVTAQDSTPTIAPVQIELPQGHGMTWWFDCYPGAGYGTDANVYLNQHDGSARYSCALVDAVQQHAVGGGRIVRVARGGAQ